jgi:hypothetical protein
MRRRRISVLLLAIAAVVPTGAAARADTVPQAAASVRAAVPAIEAYRADRGTYAGLTLARIRSYDRAVRGVAVKRASKNSYCIQSTAAGPIVHYDGPRGPVRRGRCGVNGAVVPRPATQTTQSSTDAAVAQSRLRAAIPAIETYAAENAGYTGLTLEKIRAWDYGVVGITVVWATRSAYCIQSTVGAETYHYHGPAHPVTRGRCPAAP